MGLRAYSRKPAHPELVEGWAAFRDDGSCFDGLSMSGFEGYLDKF